MEPIKNWHRDLAILDDVHEFDTAEPTGYPKNPYEQAKPRKLTVREAIYFIRNGGLLRLPTTNWLPVEALYYLPLNRPREVTRLNYTGTGLTLFS